MHKHAIWKYYYNMQLMHSICIGGGINRNTILKRHLIDNYFKASVLNILFGKVNKRVIFD